MPTHTEMSNHAGYQEGVIQEINKHTYIFTADYHQDGIIVFVSQDSPAEFVIIVL